jgi:hypothetical protein
VTADPAEPGPIEPEETGPTDEAMRADLRDRGHDPPKRGRLGRDWVALWESGEGAENIPANIPADAGVTAADFTASHAEQVTAETRPGRPKASGWRERLLGNQGKKGKHDSGKESTRRPAKPKHARVTLDRLGESAFDALAKATRIADPPLSRTFALEAPLAGMMAEDALAGTLVDKALQPIARAQAKSRILVALLGMPLGIAALEGAQLLPEQQRIAREAVVLPMIREAAVMWVEIAGDKIKEKAERDAQRGPLYEEADELLRYLLYGEPLGGQPETEPGAGQAWAAATTAPEDQAAARAQHEATPGYMGGFMAPPPARPQYEHPYPPVNPAAQLVIRPRP